MGSQSGYRSESMPLARWVEKVVRQLQLPCATPHGDERWHLYRRETAQLVRGWQRGYVVPVPLREFAHPLRTGGHNSTRFTAVCGTRAVAFRYGATGDTQRINVFVVREMEGIDDLTKRIDALSAAGYKQQLNEALMEWPRQLMMARSDGDMTKIVPSRQ